MSTSSFQTLGLVLIVIAGILHLICIAEPHYARLEIDLNVQQNSEEFKNNLHVNFGSLLAPNFLQQTLKIDVDIGIWEICFKTIGIKRCFQYGNSHSLIRTDTDAPDWLKAVQAMCIIGLLIAGAGFCLSIVTLASSSLLDRQRHLPIIISGILCFGAIALVVGNIVFGVKYDDNTFGFGDIQRLLGKRADYDLKLAWGFYVDILACVFCIGGGVLHVVWGRIRAKSNPNTNTGIIYMKY